MKKMKPIAKSIKRLVSEAVKSGKISNLLIERSIMDYMGDDLDNPDPTDGANDNNDYYQLSVKNERDLDPANSDKKIKERTRRAEVKPTEEFLKSAFRAIVAKTKTPEEINDEAYQYNSSWDEIRLILAQRTEKKFDNGELTEKQAEKIVTILGFDWFSSLPFDEQIV